MADHYDICVVGAGMMGSAAARHLVENYPSLKVVLIGPGEPKDKDAVDIHGASYDEGRLTRVTDDHPVWSILGQRSEARYRDLEKRSGISFFTEAGYMLVADKGSCYAKSYVDSGEQFNLDYSILNGISLRKKFPYFQFEENEVAIYSKTRAGHLSPRRIVEVQKLLATKSGCHIVDDVVASIKQNEDGCVVTTDTDIHYKAKKVLLATGSFTNCRHLLPDSLKPKARIMANTVIKIEIKEKDIRTYDGMPSMMVERGDVPGSFESYILPPIKYPDGKYYLKVGHGSGIAIAKLLSTAEEIRDFYRKKDECGYMEKYLYNMAERYFPDLDMSSHHYDYCVLTLTDSGFPYVDMISQSMGICIGGCGRSGKSADEIGTMAAKMIAKGSWDYDIPAHFFKFINDETKTSKL